MTPAAPPTSTNVPDLLNVLVVGDAGFADECREAFTALTDRHVVLYARQTLDDAIDIARNRQPDFAIVAIEHDAEPLTEFLKELHLAAPEVVVAGGFEPHRLGYGDSESAVLIGLLRAHVRDFLRRPISPTELRDVLDRLFGDAARPGRAVIGRVAAFIGNKGGVGKSTLSVNVACYLAKRYPGRVLLIDASLQLGICSLLLDLKPSATILDAARQRERLDETLLRGLTLAHESGLRLLAAPTDAIEAAEVSEEAIARVLSLARRTFDYVIVDTFPTLDSVAIAVLDVSDLAFVVFQGTAPSVAGAMRFLRVLEGLGVTASRQRLVLSQNHKAFLGNMSVGDIDQRLGRSVDFVVPYDKRVLVSMNTGRPHILGARRWSGFRRGVAQMANSLEQVVMPARGRRADAGAHFDTTLTHDRRSGGDRRIRDLGRPDGDRRSGRDRRVSTIELRLEPELTR